MLWPARREGCPLYQSCLGRSDDIWLHIATHDEATANRVVDTLAEACSRLGSFPDLGRSRPEIGADVRSLVSERWLILYRIEVANVLVVRVVDGARDLSKIELP